QCRVRSLGWMTTLLPPSMALMVWALILSQSRSALLGLVLSLVAMASCRKVLRASTLMWIPLGAVAMLVLMVATPFNHRFENLGSNPRLSIWSSYASETLKSGSNAITGFGTGSLGRFGAE